MTTSLHCGPALHRALAADPAAFARCSLLGYQQIEADVLELRDCAVCGCTISRALGIGARLELARAGNDIAMIGRCRRALSGDPLYVRSFIDAIEFERLMGGVR
jgi:hypothetical protein